MNDWSIEAAAEEVGERPAVVTDRETWTFADLAASTRRTAVALERVGVDFGAARDPAARPGRVMLIAENTIDTLLALYALFERGVPVMLVHPRSTAEERDALARSYPPSVRLDRAPTGCDGPAVRPALEVPAERDLAVFFTSGTTGRPKAVRLGRGAFAASARASAENLSWVDGDRWLAAIPIAHIGGLSIVTRCLLARRTVVLFSGRADPARLASRCERDAVTLISLVPTVLSRWLPAGPPSRVRAVLLGGAPAPAALRSAARRAGWPILATYGLTEACSQVTVQRLGEPTRDEDEDSGRPLPGTEVRIVDGRIHVAGPTLLSGYVSPVDGSEPERVDEWLDTGDLGQMTDDGRLIVLARREDLILTGGENVYPREVETALTDYPGVDEAVVFGLEDPEWGQVVAAVVVPETVDLDRLAVHARAVLAGPKRPRWWATAPRFALTPSGKVDRQQVIESARTRLRRLVAHGPQ